MTAFCPDGLILKIICEYVSTKDFVKLARLTKIIRASLSLPGDPCKTRMCSISTEDLDKIYVHSAFTSPSELSTFLKRLKRSGVIIPCLIFPLAEKDTLIEIIINNHKFSHFLSESRYLCEFRFNQFISTEKECVTSNTIRLMGGDLSLFKRHVPVLVNENLSHPQSALGIKLESDSIWIVRVVALTGDRRVDLKAGSTKQDPLRVPTGQRGTWSDLFPVDSGYAEKESVVFLVEFM